MTNKVVTKQIFDRKLWLNNQLRFNKNSTNYNFIYEEVARIILENIEIQNRQFKNVLEINKRHNLFAEKFKNYDYKFTDLNSIANEDNFIFPDLKFDLIISNLDLHFINDVNNFLSAVKSRLNHGGLFIASFFGDENLPELAKAINAAENEIYQGVNLRTIPYIDVKTAAHLLNFNGFSNPISSIEKITIDYSHPAKLLQDIKNSGQGNILQQRSRRFFTKTLLAKLFEKFNQFYAPTTASYQVNLNIVIISGEAK